MAIEKSAHAIHSIQYYFAWTTKGKKNVFGEVRAIRVRELIKQTCEALGIEIIKGSVGKNYVRMHLSC